MGYLPNADPVRDIIDRRLFRKLKKSGSLSLSFNVHVLEKGLQSCFTLDSVTRISILIAACSVNRCHMITLKTCRM